MPSLPTPGDPTTSGTWGDTLNTYLGVMLNSDGSLKGSGGSVLVAATDAPTLIRNRADYLCDGTADDVQINAAIVAAGEDGSVVLSAGTFTTANPITINNLDNFTLRGQGMSTTIQPAASGFPASRSIIEVGQGDGVTAAFIQHTTLESFFINAQSRGTTVNGIKFGSYNGRIRFVVVHAASGWGTWLTSPNSDANKTDIMLLGCRWGYCKLGNLFGDTTVSEDAHVIHCISMHAGKTGTTVVNADCPAIQWKGASLQMAQVHCYGNTGPAFYAPGGQISRSKITNCKFEMNGTVGSALNGGIHAVSGLNECIINGCGFRGTQGVQIFLGGGGKTVITGCVFTADNNSGNVSDKAISMSAATNNVVVGNWLGTGYVTSPALQYSTADGHIVRNNKGWVTNNRGRDTQSGTGSKTAFTIAHGLSTAPTTAQVTAGSAAARGDFSIATDSTNITVTYATAPVAGTNNVVLNWSADQ